MFILRFKVIYLISFCVLQVTESDEKDVSQGCYGNLPLIQSQERIDRKILALKELTADLADKKVWVRARLQTSRSKGKDDCQN